MGLLKKIFKGVKKVFKKIGKAIKRTFKKIGKVFNKLGVVGTIALAIIAPYALPALTSFAGAAAASSNVLVSGFGKLLGTGLKFASGASKALGAVSKAVGQTISNVAGKVGGEFLKKMGIENFMGKDLTKLDSWGDIWTKTQDSFAGVKDAWKTGIGDVQSQFDVAKATAETPGLEGVSTPMPEGAMITDPNMQSSLFDPNALERGMQQTMQAPLPQAQTMMPQGAGVTSVAGTDQFMIDPTALERGMQQTLETPSWEELTRDGLEAAQQKGESSFFSTEYGKPSLLERGKAFVADAGKDIFSELKDEAKGKIKDKFQEAIFGSEQSTGEGTGGGSRLGIVDPLPMVQIAQGSQVSAIGVEVNPQSDWALQFAQMPTAYNPFDLITPTPRMTS